MEYVPPMTHPPSASHAISVGKLMCEVTQNILWQPAASLIQQRTPGAILRCRVGSGQATYHRFDPVGKEHRITYGTRMIVAKHRPETAAGWLSSREISERGYFGRQLSTLNLLAHTCCHEFAHLLQHSAGQRRRGSVHNRSFYDILDRLHAHGEASAVRDELMRQARLSALSISDQPFELASAVDVLAGWRVGDRVEFGTRGSRRQGVIERINRKTATVRASGGWQDLRYRVPASMLSRPGA